MSNVLVVSGQSGVGKDFLVERAEPAEYGLTHANWGDLFSQQVGQDKDHLTYVPDARETTVIQGYVVQKVLEMQPAVVTSHPVKIEDGREFVNWDIERLLSPSDYVFIRANPELISERVRRRNELGLRRTPELSVAEIGHQQERKLQLIAELAGYVGSTLTVINNGDGNVEDSTLALRLVFAKINEQVMNGTV